MTVGGGSFGLRYLEPARDLRGIVSSYYLFWADMAEIADLTRADLPQLRFMLSGTGDYALGGLASIDAPDIALIGPTMAASRFAVRGPLMVFGAAFLPAGWAALGA